MKDETCNGWTNYATWRVMLEIFDGMDIRDITTSTEPYEAVEALEDYIDNVVFSESMNRLAKGYAFAFLEQVNLREIAQHMLQQVAETE